MPRQVRWRPTLQVKKSPATRGHSLRGSTLGSPREVPPREGGIHSRPKYRCLNLARRMACRLLATRIISVDSTPPPESAATCPPDVKGEPPTVGGGSSEPLSDKLARSKGVICPPAGIDRDMQVTPPSGGHLKVIPPPGTPGGDPNVQPK